MDIHGSYGWLVPWYSARLVANPVVRLFPVCLKDIVQDLKAHLPRNQENLGCCPTAAACFWIDLYMDLGWDSPKTSLEKNMENSPWTRSTQSQFTLNWRSEQLPNHPREDWEVDLISASIQWYGSCPKCCFRCANKSTSLFSQTTMQLPEDTSLQIGNPSAHVVNNNEKHSNFKIPSGLII